MTHFIGPLDKKDKNKKKLKTNKNQNKTNKQTNAACFVCLLACLLVGLLVHGQTNKQNLYIVRISHTALSKGHLLCASLHWCYYTVMVCLYNFVDLL